MTPAADQLLAVLGLGLDGHHGARQAEGGQPLVQLVSQGLGHERGRVHPLCRRVQLGGDRQVRRRRSSRQRAVVLAARQIVGDGPGHSETAQHRRSGQGGQVTQGADPQPRQQVGQRLELRPQGTRPAGAPARCGLAPGGTTSTGPRPLPAGSGRPGRQPGGKAAVGHPDPAPGLSHRPVHLLGHPVGQAPRRRRSNGTAPGWPGPPRPASGSPLPASTSRGPPPPAPTPGHRGRHRPG